MNICTSRERPAGACARLGIRLRRWNISMPAKMALLFAASLVHNAQAAPSLPPTAFNAFSPSLIAVGGSSLLTITLTNDNDDTITGARFTDTFSAPINLVNAGSDTVVENSCNAFVDAPPNGTYIVATSGMILPHASCKISVNVVATAAGASTNDTGPIASDNAPSGAAHTATLTITASPLMTAPIVSNTFLPDSVPSGGSSALTIHIDNVENLPITGARFSDTYAAGIANATDGPVILANTCLGTITAEPGASGFTLVDAVIPAASSCDVVVNISAYLAGIAATDSTTQIFSGNAYPGNSSTGTLTITNEPPIFEPVANVEFLPSEVAVGGTSQLHVTLSNFNGSSINGIGFTAQYVAPAHFLNDSGGAIFENTCGGTVVADDNASTFSLVGGQLAPGTTCELRINVIGALAGAGDVQTSAIASSNARTGASAAATLTVSSDPLLSSPVVTKTFAPSTLPPGGASQMTITFANPNAADAISGVQLFDAYPPGLKNASDSVVFSNTCGGNVIADVDGNSATLLGGSIPPQTDCAVVINVVGTAANTTVENHTGAVVSANAFDALDASAQLHVTATPLLIAPVVTKAFSPPHIDVGGSSQMTITLSNPNGASITAAQIADIYPLGLLNAGGNAVLSDSCNFIKDVPSNGAWAKLSNGTVTGPSCSIVISVVGTSSATNTTGAALSANAAPGGAASAALAVGYGGLTAQNIVFTSPPPNNALVGGPTYLATATATSGLSIALTIDAPSANVCAITNGTVAFIGQGTCTIDANQDGDANYAPAPQVQQSFVVNPSSGSFPQTIGFTTAAPQNAQVNGLGYVPGATASSGLPVTLTIDPASSTVCVISNGIVSYLGAGTCTIDANQSGNATYAPAPQVQQSFGVASAGGATPQSITFATSPPANAIVGGPAYAVAATATSNLSVALTIDPISTIVCTISNGNVSFIGPGTCTIDANQGGDAIYAPAPQVQQSFTVGSSGSATPQAIVFVSTSPANATVGGQTYQVAATASSGLPVVLTIDSSSTTVCTIAASSVSFIGPGACNIDANQGGNAVFAPAAQVQQSVPVAPAGGTVAQSILFTSDAPDDATVAGAPYIVTADATSLLPVVLTVETTSATVCAIANGTVSFVGAGTCTIDANQGGDATYLPAAEAQQSFSVAPATGVTPQTIGFATAAPNDAKVGGVGYLPIATATSGLPVVLTIDASSATVCQIDAGNVSFVGAGTCTIDANQGGDATYAASPQVQQTFPVSAPDGILPQTIAFTSSPPANVVVGSGPYLVTAVATSGLPVILTIDVSAAAACTINNGTVLFVGPGECVIDATQGGDATFAPAPMVQQAFEVHSGGSAPTINCLLPDQADVVGDSVNIDLSLLFLAPPGDTLTFGAGNIPPSLSLNGSLLTGTLQVSDVPPAPPYAYLSTLTAIAIGSGMGASENVTFQVLPIGEILLRNGFDPATSAMPCQ